MGRGKSIGGFSIIGAVLVNAVLATLLLAWMQLGATTQRSVRNVAMSSQWADFTAQVQNVLHTKEQCTRFLQNVAVVFSPTQPQTLRQCVEKIDIGTGSEQVLARGPCLPNAAAWDVPGTDLKINGLFAVGLPADPAQPLPANQYDLSVLLTATKSGQRIGAASVLYSLPLRVSTIPAGANVRANECIDMRGAARSPLEACRLMGGKWLVDTTTAPAREKCVFPEMRVTSTASFRRALSPGENYHQLSVGSETRNVRLLAQNQGVGVTARYDGGSVSLKSDAGVPAVSASADLRCPAGQLLRGIGAQGLICEPDQNGGARTLQNAVSLGGTASLVAGKDPASSQILLRALEGAAPIRVSVNASGGVTNLRLSQVNPPTQVSCGAGETLVGFHGNRTPICVSTGTVGDLKCDRPGSCAQVCLGGDCRRDWNVRPGADAVCRDGGLAYSPGARCRLAQCDFTTQPPNGLARFHACRPDGTWSAPSAETGPCEGVPVCRDDHT
ncbi:MAG: hypothetical protein AB7F66_07140 [Bacteriovoracia bacterium]